MTVLVVAAITKMTRAVLLPVPAHHIPTTTSHASAAGTTAQLNKPLPTSCARTRSRVQVEKLLGEKRTRPTIV
jgi:hypothetical protein